MAKSCTVIVKMAVVDAHLLHLLLKNCDFLNTDISQGSVATHLVFGGVFKYSFVTNFLLSLTLKEFWKSVNIWWSYGQEFGVLFFWDTVYINNNEESLPSAWTPCSDVDISCNKWMNVSKTLTSLYLRKQQQLCDQKHIQKCSKLNS